MFSAKVVTLSLKGALLSLLLFERSVLTLYVKEKVGANEGEYHHRDRQSAVRHHLSDSVIQIRAAGKQRHIFQHFFNFLNCDVINPQFYYSTYSGFSFS